MFFWILSLSLFDLRPSAGSASPSKVVVDGERVGIGKISVNPKERRLSFPAEVNLTEELLEYVLVEKKGKVHEALLATEVAAMDLQLAVLLISDKKVRETEAPREPQAPVRDARPLWEIRLEWTDSNGLHQLFPVEHFILIDPPKIPMPETLWLFQGSRIIEGGLEASSTGSLISIIESPDAIFAYPGVNRENDEIWFANRLRLPPKGTPVRVLVQRIKDPD